MSAINKRAAVICISVPYPASTGTRLRSQSVIQSLIAQGYKVTVIYPRDTHESDSEIARQLGLEKAVSLPVTRRKLLMVQDYLKFFFRIKENELPYSQLRLSFCAKKILRRFQKEEMYDVVVTEYSTATVIRSYIISKFYILDTCDLMSIHNQKVRASQEALSRWEDMGDPAFLELQFSETLDPVISEEEIAELKQYDAIIAISDSEFQKIDSLHLEIPNYLISPCVATPTFEKTDYTGFPVFAYSTNIFNTQGLIHFINKLLPAIIRIIPEFKLLVTGNAPTEAVNCPYLVCLGFVNNIHDIYKSAGFSIIPTFGGTGQQLKVPEVMSYSLAVVGYHQRIDRGILSDGIEGYLANNEEEFITGVVKLWTDRELAETMGRNARKKVSLDLSQESFNSAFRTVIMSLEASVQCPEHASPSK